MGFTPLEGLVMGTRSGSVDPGMLLWLQTEAGLGAAEILDILERRSGLLGLCGSADVPRGAGEGAGENSADIRETVCARLHLLGVEIDPASNRTGTGDRQIGATASAAAVLVIASRADLTIAAEVRRLHPRV